MFTFLFFFTMLVSSLIEYFNIPNNEYRGRMVLICCIAVPSLAAILFDTPSCIIKKYEATSTD